MANLSKNNENSKNFGINLKKIFSELSQSPQPLLVLASKHYNLEFKKVGKRYISQYSGVKIEPVKNNSRFYTLNNYSNKEGIPSGQIKHQVFELTGNLKGLEQFKKQVEILTNCGLIDENLVLERSYISKFADSRHFTTKNTQSQAKSTKAAKKPVFVDFNTPYGNKVFNYLHKKTGSSLETLLKYGVFATTSRDEIRYSYQVGATIKSKFPNRKVIDGKFSVFNYSSDYIFGLDQLPSKGKILILASGEDDALCINQNFNQNGVFAIASWNETTCIPKTVANDLLKRFERCFVLGDNDNPQTTAKSLEIAQKTGFIWIDTDFARSCLDIPIIYDVCDIYQNRKIADIKQFITFCLETNHQLPKYDDDPDSISVDHCFKINHRKYIGQAEPNEFGIIPSQFIKNVITHYDRSILDGLAGIGKSNLIGQLVNDFPVLFEGCQPFSKHLELLGIERTIVLEPTTAITDQLSSSFKEWKLKVATIKGGSGTVQQADIINESVCVVTFDSLCKIAPLVENSFLIIDEFHQLSIDLSYRDKGAFKLIEQLMYKAKKLLLISATPTLIYTQGKELHNKFGFKLIKAITGVKNRIEVTEVRYKGALKNVPLHIIDNYAHEEGTLLIKRDDKKTLNAAAKVFEERGLKQDVFYSKDRHRKEDNKNYQSVMESGHTVEQLAALLITALFEAGVSLKFLVSLICLLDVESWQKVIQFASRPRYNEKTGINKVNKVHIYRSARERKGDDYDTNPVINEFKKLLNTAQFHCGIINSQKRGLKEYGIKDLDENDIELITMFNEQTGKKEPSIFGINLLLYRKQIKRPFNLFLKRLQRYDDRIVIMPSQTIRAEGNELYKSIVEAQKIEKQEANLKFLKLLDQDFTMTAQVVYYKSLDVEFKKRLQNSLGLMPANPVEVQNFLAQSNGAFTGDEPKRIFNDICFFKRNTTLNLQDSIQKVVNSEKKDIQAEKNQINRHKRRTALRQENEATTEEQRLSAEQKLQIARINGICLTVDQYRKDFKQGKSKKEYLTSKDIHNLINRGIEKANRDCKKRFKKVKSSNLVKAFKAVNPSKAKLILTSLYEVKEERIYINKKRTRVTRILGKISTPKYIRK